jgi:hypothetical protein
MFEEFIVLDSYDPSLFRYSDYEVMDKYTGRVPSFPLPPTEPDMFDKLAAIGDPDGPAGQRVKAWKDAIEAHEKSKQKGIIKRLLNWIGPKLSVEEAAERALEKLKCEDDPQRTPGTHSPLITAATTRTCECLGRPWNPPQWIASLPSVTQKAPPQTTFASTTSSRPAAGKTSRPSSGSAGRQAGSRSSSMWRRRA